MNMVKIPIFNANSNSDHLASSLRFYKNGYTSKLHWHDFFELEVILEGNGIHTFNDEKYDIYPGHAYISAYNDFHAISALSDLTIYNVSFSPPSIDSGLLNILSSSTQNHKCILSKNDMEHFFAHTEQNLVHCEHNAYFSKLLKKIHTEELLITIIQQTEKSNDIRIPAIIQKCISIINNEFRDDITLDSIAKKLYFTPNYLGSIFKDAIGSSFRVYLNAVRLRYARNLLKSTTLSVKEISAMSGYKSVEYFTYVFKQSIGISPTQYKQK